MDWVVADLRETSVIKDEPGPFKVDVKEFWCPGPFVFDPYPM